MDISLQDHTQFFAGYLDAVSRLFTTDKTLVTGSARMLEQGETLDMFFSSDVTSCEAVDNIEVRFEKDIAAFLQHDPGERILFYLTEYVHWFDDISRHFSCERVYLDRDKGEYLAYWMKCNEHYKVGIVITKDEKPILK